MGLLLDGVATHDPCKRVQGYLTRYKQKISGGDSLAVRTYWSGCFTGKDYLIFHKLRFQILSEGTPKGGNQGTLIIQHTYNQGIGALLAASPSRDLAALSFHMKPDVYSKQGTWHIYYLLNHHPKPPRSV